MIHNHEPADTHKYPHVCHAHNDRTVDAVHSLITDNSYVLYNGRFTASHDNSYVLHNGRFTASHDNSYVLHNGRFTRSHSKKDESNSVQKCSDYLVENVKLTGKLTTV